MNHREARGKNEEAGTQALTEEEILAQDAALDRSIGADLLRRSGRDLSKFDPSDTMLLKDAMSELRCGPLAAPPLPPLLSTRCFLVF